jgi:hypothetical protein
MNDISRGGARTRANLKFETVEAQTNAIATVEAQTNTVAMVEAQTNAVATVEGQKNTWTFKHIENATHFDQGLAVTHWMRVLRFDTSDILFAALLLQKFIWWCEQNAITFDCG